jgi:hypothetical protein
LVNDLCVSLGFDTDGLSLSFCHQTGGCCLCFGFDLCAFSLGFSCGDNTVGFRVGLGLRYDQRWKNLPEKKEKPTFRAFALIRATLREPSSCFTLLLFSLSTFCMRQEN